MLFLLKLPNPSQIPFCEAQASLHRFPFVKAISYSTKVSELAKIYPLARVVHYDDLYRRMQFATGCKWGTESQFIYQQSPHKSDTNQPGSTKQANRPPGRSTPTINPTTGKQVCYDFQRRQGCSYGTACKYDGCDVVSDSFQISAPVNLGNFSI